MKQKTILISALFFHPNIGGVERHLLALTNYLSSKDYKVVVITFKPLVTKVKNYLSYEKNGNLEIHRIWWFGQNFFEYFTKIPALEFIYMVPRLCTATLWYSFKHRKEIDVFHAHGLIAAVVIRIVQIFVNKPAVMSTHSIYNLQDHPFLSAIMRFTLKSFSHILAVGEASKQDLINGKINKEKIVIFKQWIDQETFKPLNKQICRQKIGLNADNNIFVVLFVGRLLEMKGVKVLISTAEKFNRNIIFAFVGSGFLENYLKETVEKKDNIFYFGKKNAQELVDYYNAADIIAIPTQKEEGSPLVVLEALSCGRPLITTNKGCITEMFNNSVGVSIDPTAENLYTQIKFFVENKKIVDEMSANARKFALDHFSDKNAQIIENSYFNNICLK